MPNNVRIQAALDDKVSSPLDRIRGKIDTLGKGSVGASFLGNLAAGGVAKGIGFVAEAFGKVTDAVGASIGKASDLAEAQGKVGVVFGSSAKDIESFAGSADRAFGLSKTAALGFAGTFGNLFMNLDLGGAKSAEMSKSIIGLGGDLASFNNIETTDALDKLRAGLAGEAEPLRSLGVFLTEAKVKAEAMALGLVEAGGEMTEAAKVQARYSLILKETTLAQGDFARTSSGMANQERINAARMENAWTRVGQVLTPIAKTIMPLVAEAALFIVEGVEKLIKSIASWMRENKVIVDVLKTVAGVLVNVLGFALGLVGKAVGDFAKMFGDAFGAVVTVVQAVVGTVIGYVRNMMGVIAEIPGPWQEGAKAVKATLDGMQKDVESWGQKTVGVAAGTGRDSIEGLAGALVDGAPVVGAAAEEGLADPMTGAVKEAVWDVKARAQDLPGQMAANLREGRQTWVDAWDAFKDNTETSMSRVQEIASIKAKLAGKDIAAGLASTDPIRRAETAAIVAQLETRLGELRSVSYKQSTKAGDDIARALRETKKGTKAAAELHELAVKNALGTLPSSAYGWGKSTAREFAEGLGSKAAVTAAANAAARVAAAAAAYLEIRSPAKEGPLSRGGGPGGWGAKLSSSFGDGMDSGVRRVTAAASNLAGAAIPGLSLGPLAMGAAMGGAALGAPAAASGSPVVIQLNLDGREVARVVEPLLYYRLAAQR